MSDRKDPRFRNERIQADSLSGYYAGYLEGIRVACESVDQRELERAFEALADVIQQDKRVYVAGNGGSSAIADHLCCDWMKGTRVPEEPSLMVHSLSSNMSLLTALANDCGYENSLSAQVEMLGRAGDVLVLISASGNSENIVRAAEAGRVLGLTVIGLSGFNGGKLAELSQISLYVKANNYGIVEDSHQILMHILAQYLARMRDERKLCDGVAVE